MSVNDGRRFRIFAEFIRDTYPDVKTIADVAGGRGALAFFLRKRHGYDATVIDIRDARLPGRMHRALRRQSMRLGRLVEVPRIVGKLQDIDLRPFDLIVGLHPDEATEHVVRAGIELGKNFAIVPCCVFPIDGVRRSQEGWREYLGSLSSDIRTASLAVNGANTVLYRRLSPAGNSRLSSPPPIRRSTSSAP